MLNDYLDTLLNAVENELLSGTNKSITTKFNELAELLNSSDEHRPEMASALALDFTSEYCRQKPEDSLEKFIQQALNSLVKETKSLARNYIVEANVKGLEDYVYRKINVPACASMADLSAVILNAFGCDDGHMFHLEYKNENFSIFDDDDETRLGFMNIRKNSKMTLIYDYGEDYEISIKFTDIIKETTIPNFGELEILETKGSYIWENSHELMEYFYTDKASFNSMVKDLEINLENYEFEMQICDLDELNDDIAEEALFTKEMYQDNYEELDELDPYEKYYNDFF